MPILPPALDDRSFTDLVDEAISRIPAHTPEWTNPREGDPGRTIIELFAWLTDTLLYRANLIPERQRLAFLRLLGERMRPARAARGLVSVSIDQDGVTSAVQLAPLAALGGPVPFETRSELTVLPVSGDVYCKRPLTTREETQLAPLVDGLRQVYGVRATPYVTSPVFLGGAPEPAGFDLVSRTLDRCLWIALLGPKDATPAMLDEVRATLGTRSDGAQHLLSVGVLPATEVPPLAADVGPRPPVPHVWETTMLDASGALEYHTLDRIADTSAGLTQPGVIRLALPASSRERSLAAPDNDVRRTIDAGVGDRPPRLDDPESAARLVTWLRLRPTTRLSALPLSWVGVNAVEIDQRTTLQDRVIGVSDGAANQEMALPARSVEAATLQVQVDEAGRGFQTWQRVDDLMLAGRDDSVYTLDEEAGTIGFGDGVRGRVPETGRRVRLALMRSGGGRAGNLPARTLKKISAHDVGGAPVTLTLKVDQGIPTMGGAEAETLEEAERRIPAVLRHRDRAVTEDDFRRLSADTPGVRLGRVEVLPRFKPQQRRANVPGVVTVMVLPQKEGTSAPAPRPDRPLLEAVHRHLDTRRALTTELYVIGCEYVALGLGVGVTVRDGFAHDETMHAVREGLRAVLWSLSPGGASGTGWQLGRAVSDRELEVAVARVPGVNTVTGVRLFERRNDGWQPISVPDRSGSFVLPMRSWQLPELLSVVVRTDGLVPNDLRAAPNPFLDDLSGSGTGTGSPNGTGSSNGTGSPNGTGSGLLDVAVPVVPEVC
jgi:predicted phage baseplate assembly protein